MKYKICTSTKNPVQSSTWMSDECNNLGNGNDQWWQNQTHVYAHPHKGPATNFSLRVGQEVLSQSNTEIPSSIMRKKINLNTQSLWLSPNSLQWKQPLCWGSRELAILFVILPSQILSSSSIRDFITCLKINFTPTKKLQHPSITHWAMQPSWLQQPLLLLKNPLWKTVPGTLSLSGLLCHKVVHLSVSQQPCGTFISNTLFPGMASLNPQAAPASLFWDPTSPEPPQ